MRGKKVGLFLFILVCIIVNVNAQKGSELKVFTKMDAPFLLYVNKKKVTENYTKEIQLNNLHEDEVKLKIVFENRKIKTLKKTILLKNPITERSLKVDCLIAIGKKGKINLGRTIKQLSE